MKLQEARERAGMTQLELAEKAGIKIQAVQHYEQGYRDINKAAALTVFKLAKALHTDVGDLLEDVR